MRWFCKGAKCHHSDTYLHMMIFSTKKEEEKNSSNVPLFSCKFLNTIINLNSLAYFLSRSMFRTFFHSKVLTSGILLMNARPSTGVARRENNHEPSEPRVKVANSKPNKKKEASVRKERRELRREEFLAPDFSGNLAPL